MNLWMALLIPSAVFGAICALVTRNKLGMLIAGLLPWMCVLAALLYSVYVVPFEAMDASMWPIAQFFGGNAAAFSGVMGFVAMRWFRDVKGRGEKGEESKNADH